jgi:peptidoglycan/xylan/chitin deacetylase (PgdA/CDA1 family)
VVWPDGAKLALQIAVNFEEGSEYSVPNGDGRNEMLAEVNYGMPAEYRDLCVESVYEYGSRAGNWRLLRLFEEYGIDVTYFAAAIALETNPDVAGWLRDSGHEVCSHGWRWEEHWLLSAEEEREHIRRAIDSIERTCGQRPLGWYCRYCPSTRTRELLVEEGGFVYDADAYNDDLPYFVDVGATRHLVVPYSATYNDSRFVFAQGYSSPNDFFETCRDAMDELRREGNAGYPKMMSIGLHPRLAGQAARTAAVRRLIEHALSTDDVWIATRLDIARWWLNHHEEFAYE